MKRWFRYFILFFVISFCYSYFFTCVYTDEIWNYGFSYNIANGLVPYRDFNMVITPLYHMLVSIFINIFGHHLYALHIFNSFVVASILLIFVYKLGKKGLLLFSFVFLNIYPGYNIFCVLLILILLNLCDKEFRYKDILMGILVGIFFLIKQNVGFCLFIPMIYYSRNRIKSFISFCIPVFIFLIYLIWNNALYQFIDYCFLGLFEFGDSNSIFLFLPVELVVCATLGYKLLKSKFIKQQLFYLLMYQIITIPIVDDYHFMIGFIPVFYYYLFNRMIVTYKLKYYFLMVLSFCGLWNFSVRGYEVGHLYSDKNSYLNGRNVPSYVEDIVDGISNYIEEKKDDYDYIFF